VFLTLSPVALEPRAHRTFLAIAILIAGWMALGHANDFLVYWEAGRDLRVGGWEAVYDVTALTPFKYHPVFALAFWPWGLLPSSLARLLWAALHGGLLYDLQRRWAVHWKLDPVAIGLGLFGVVHALTWEVKFGNVPLVMLWLFTAALTTPRAQLRALWHGVLITLKPYWLVLILPWTLGRRSQLLLGAALAALFLSMLPLLGGLNSGQQAYGRWLATLVDPAENHNYPKTDNQGWYGLLARHQDALQGALPWLWLAGSALVALLWLIPWLRRRSESTPVEEAAREITVLPLFLWAAPLSWVHHQLLLWPLMALLWRQGRTNRTTRWVWVIVWVLLNGSGQALLGRSLSEAIQRVGLPAFAFPLLAWWGARLGSQVLQPKRIT
jgi:hypothetical protein